MIGLFRKLLKDRRGNALVIAGAALPLIIGSAGLASDTIQWALMKRQLQRTADSAALAGVYGKLASQTVNTGTCSASGSQPVYRDVFIQSNANARVDGTVTCTVGTPASPWNGSGYNAVAVTVSTSRAMGFSGLFLSTPPTITASATAAVVQSGKYCVISLDTNSDTGISFSGNAQVNLGCGLKTNAKGSSAIDGTGSSTITASPVAAVGQISNGGNFASGTTFQPYSSPQTDPYASINAPDSSTFPNGNCPNFSVNSNQTVTSIRAGTDYKAMSGASTGYYCMGSMNLNGTVTLPSGVYVIDGGDFSVGAQANVTCTGCTFILTNRSTSTSPAPSIGKVNMNGGATVDLTNSTSGTYANMLFYQDRRATLANGNGQSNLINGNSSSTIQGTMYFPSTSTTFNGTSGLSTNCVQLVGWQVAFTGNTTISNTCPSGGPHAFDGTMVRLVA